MKRTALALVLLLPACSGGGGGGFNDTRAVAEALGCEGSHELDPPDTLSLGAKETATCDAGGGRDYSLAVFSDDEKRDIFVEGISGLGGAFAVGDGWAVGAQTVADAEKAAEELGGEVVE